MKATYNKSKIMRNAWYLKKANASMSFSLRQALRRQAEKVIDGCDFFRYQALRMIFDRL